jgi:phytoene/squalene synthetase
MPDRSEFYQQHLDRVSRSFAFCIRQLPEPLRDWVSLSYLLCRTLDTIEDAKWNSDSEQIKAFHAFDAALKRIEDAGVLQTLTLPPDVPQSEEQLLKDSPVLFEDFHKLGGGVRETMGELIGIMSAGMQTFMGRREKGHLRLRTLNEVNQYCFFVAGVVGELLAKLVGKVEPRFKVNPLNLLRAHHFGLFLQKVNLLKDQVRDEKEGRHLIPSREQVESSSAENARWALEFLMDIPPEQLEFRRFCAWSLFLGLEALNAARRSVGEQKVIKVARRRTDELLEEVESNLLNNSALNNMFQAFKDRLGWVVPTDDTPRSLSQLGVTT